jgi:hypothetical protein
MGGIKEDLNMVCRVSFLCLVPENNTYGKEQNNQSHWIFW